jgi:phosphoribosylformimino-5-aminoimidazole carboxamide ribotide isomerase
MMKVIPAIDLMDGKCVRLTEGNKELKTTYDCDPVEAARAYAEEGAELIHVVDLDGAFSGQPVNLATLKKIVQAVQVPIEFGGGIRDLSSLEKVFNCGVNRVVLGTTAITDPDFFLRACHQYRERIWVGLDAKDGMIAIKGWEETTPLSVEKLLTQVSRLPIGGVIYTDVGRDGKLAGPNLASLKKLAQATSLPVVASGGVSSLEDIAELAKLTSLGVVGVIVGKALYTKKFKLAEALKVWERGEVVDAD